MTDLFFWSWIFVVLYLLGMLAIGVYAGRQVTGGDDYAVARGAYGPLMLALAFAATTASGATFLGIPGLAYKLGVSAMWYAFLYPIGVYLGVLICLKAVTDNGNRFASRSIPEYLGDRYQSDFLRISFSLFSLILLFYLAGQLVAGLVMFEQLLGLSPLVALMITTVVLMIYVVIGGAHADIITDGVQGFAMLVIAVIVTVLFVLGVDINGEKLSFIQALSQQDSQLVRPFVAENPVFASPITIIAIVIAHIPLGMLPHIGNKLWALEDGRSRARFLRLAFTFGMILPCMVFGGIMARVILGDDLLASGLTPNEAIPALFIHIMPAWLAALLSVAILSAIMSTADGLVVSASQVFANDIYRRTIAPKWHSHLTQEALDKRVLAISRWGTIVVLLGSAVMAWLLIDMNVALLVWIGIGGITSALAGPLVLGSLWQGVNRAGATAGLLTGVVSFIVLHTGWLAIILNLPADAWLAVQSSNPYVCSSLGAILSVFSTVLVSVSTAKQNQNGNELFID